MNLFIKVTSINRGPELLAISTIIRVCTISNPPITCICRPEADNVHVTKSVEEVYSIILKVQQTRGTLDNLIKET